MSRCSATGTIPTYEQLTELLQWLVPVTFMYYDAKHHEIIYWGDNRHGSWWNPWMHDVLHKTMNSMRESGLEFSDITADGDGSLDSHAQFGISAGSCFHGDMRRESLGVAAPADLPVFYFIAGDLPRIHETSVNSLVVDGLLCYNQNGAAVPATDGWFVMVHVFFTNCLYHPFIAVMGQAQYERVSTASYMVNSEVTLVRDKLPHQNLLHVGTLILQTSAAFSNSAHSRIVTHAYGVKTDLSVTGDGSLVKPVVLVNDLDLPGPEKYYGTDKDEIKGFHDFPEIDPRLLSDGQAIYLHGNESDVSGYSRALPLAPEDDRTVYFASADQSTGEVLIRSFVTDAGFPGVELIPSGPWVFEHHMAVTTDDRCSLVVRVFRRDLVGVESELFSFEQRITDVVTARYLKAVAVDNVHLLEGDRLVFKYYHKSESFYSRTMYLDVEGITPDTRKWSCVRIPLPSVPSLSLIEDIGFDWNDIQSGVPQTYVLVLSASYAFRIISVALQSDSTMEDVTVEINGSPVTWADDAISVDVPAAPSILEKLAKTDYDNLVSVGAQVTLVTSGIDGLAEVLRGAIRTMRV